MKHSNNIRVTTPLRSVDISFTGVLYSVSGVGSDFGGIFGGLIVYGFLGRFGDPIPTTINVTTYIAYRVPRLNVTHCLRAQPRSQPSYKSSQPACRRQNTTPRSQMIEYWNVLSWLSCGSHPSREIISVPNHGPR